MRRILALTLVLCAVGMESGQGQVTDETLVPRGRLRLLFQPSFTYWDSRFGERVVGGTVVEEQEPLGMDLTDETGTAVFPGIAALEEELRALTGSDFSASVGSSQAVVNHDVTRIDLGAHVGVFDWLTLGIVVPYVKNRTALQLAFRPDTVNGTFGINPSIDDSQAVTDFLAGLEAALAAAAANAEAACSASPGSASCTDASELSSRVDAFATSTRSAYAASSLFPKQGSAPAVALTTVTADLDNALTQAGLPGIGSMVFATEFLGTGSLANLPATPGSGIQGRALSNVEALWEIGDIELSALVRLLRGEVRDSGAVAARFSYSVGAGFVARLGTGARDATDVFLDLSTGDGQTDFEGRIFGFFGVGTRLGLRGAVRHGVQQPTTLLRRVVAPEVVLALAGTLRAVRWSPASYTGIEIEPALRLTEALSLFGSYRLFSKGDDTYEIIGDPPAGSRPVDPADLERESGVRLQQLGLGLRYSTVGQWRDETIGGSPMELYFRFLYATSGSGGQTPVSTRAELGIRLFRGLWGTR